MKKQKTYRDTMRACSLASVSQAIINNLSPLLFVLFQDAYGVSLERIGLLILLNFGTQLAVDALCVHYADRIGQRPLIVVAHGLCAAGLVLLSVLPGLMPSVPYLGLSLAVVTYAVGGGLIEVLASPIADALPGDAKAMSMSLLHSFYCWGHVLVVLLTMAGLSVVGQGGWRWLPVLWAVVPAYNAVNFLRVPLVPVPPESERTPLSRLLSSKGFLLAVLLMACSGAAEQAMSQWASLFAQRGLQLSKAMGDLLGPCLFAALMGLGRVLYGVWGNRLRLSRALSLSAVLCVVCYLVTALSVNPAVALVGCAVTGFSVSLMWPGMLSLCARAFPASGTALFSLLALGGDLGCSVGPWLTGLVSDVAIEVPGIVAIGARAGLNALQTGLKSGLLAAVVFPAALLIGVLLLQRMRGAKAGL